MEGGSEGGDICLPMADSCWCTAEANTMLQSNYLQKKKVSRISCHSNPAEKKRWINWEINYIPHLQVIAKPFLPPNYIPKVCSLKLFWVRFLELKIRRIWASKSTYHCFPQHIFLLLFFKLLIAWMKYKDTPLFWGKGSIKHSFLSPYLKATAWMDSNCLVCLRKADCSRSDV